MAEALLSKSVSGCHVGSWGRTLSDLSGGSDVHHKVRDSRLSLSLMDSLMES